MDFIRGLRSIKKKKIPLYDFEFLSKSPNLKYY